MDYRPIILDTIDSTNNYAINLISKSNPIEGTVITTYNQSSGRGQIGRNWFSDINKNITASIITYPKFLKVHEQFYLSIALSLAIFDTINKIVDHSVFIKWPNDIYVGNNKIAGLLIQLGLQGPNISYGVLGIGLNVNQKEFPPELPNPISLFNLINKKSSLVDLLSVIFGNFEGYYSILQKGERKKILNKYNSRLYRKGIETTFMLADNQEIKATPLGIKDTGHLVLEHNSVEKHYSLSQLRMKI